MKTKLPEGWKEVELGDVLNYEQPTDYIVASEDYADEYETPVLTAGKSFILGYTDEKKGIYNKLPVIIFDDFTVASKYVTFPFKVKSSAMKLLTPKTKEINLKYIFWLMQTIKVNSVSHKRYYLSKYQHIKIPLPPLPTQRKIVEILEEADNLRKLRRQADEKMKDLTPSLFVEMFGDTATNPKGWEITSISEICNLVNGKAFKPADWSETGIPIIRIQNLNDDTKPFNYFDGNIEQKYCVKNDDVLLSWSGTPGTSFGAHIWKRGDGVLNQHIFRVELLEDKILKKIFVSIVNRKLYELINKAHGGVGLSHITKGRLENIKIPLPPLPLQQEFAERVREIEAEKERQAESKKKLDDLFNSLMQRAFNGELVA